MTNKKVKLFNSNATLNIDGVDDCSDIDAHVDEPQEVEEERRLADGRIKEVIAEQRVRFPAFADC